MLGIRSSPSTLDSPDAMSLNFEQIVMVPSSSLVIFPGQYTGPLALIPTLGNTISILAKLGFPGSAFF